MQPFEYANPTSLNDAFKLLGSEWGQADVLAGGTDQISLMKEMLHTPKRVVNIKKGQFVAPWDMRHVVDKCRTAGNDRVFVTERGSSFGYNNLVVDMRSLAIMRKFVPVVFDATHSVQLPSASQGDQKQGDEKQGDEKKDQPASSGGQPEFIPVLARAAVAAGVDGVFMEVHDKPQEAKSDGANALDSHKLRGVLKELLAVHHAVASGEIAVRRVRRTLG